MTCQRISPNDNESFCNNDKRIVLSCAETSRAGKGLRYF